jgi:hypothetical protein
MTAPGPPEVEAEELAAAEEWARDFAAVSTVHGPQMVGRLLAEFDRMRAELHAREFAASYQAATIGRLRRDRDKLQVDLARALPVVEAAGALVEHDRAKPALGKSITAWRVRRRELLDALARAVDAEIKGRES